MSTLPAGRLRRLHINQHTIRANAASGAREPVITVKSSDANDYAHEAIIRTGDGTEIARVVYRPDRPLSCGAKVWIETRAQVDLVRHDGSEAAQAEQEEDVDVLVRFGTGEVVREIPR